MLTPPLLEIRGVAKTYGGLRPLRVDGLTVSSHETVVVEGPDLAGAAALVDLITGTTLPDAGEILVGGRATGAIPDHEAWLAFLDQFGIVNSRVVLLDELSVLQNLAVPLTLDLDPLPEDVRRRALALAAEVRLEPAACEERLAQATPLARMKVKVGRAIGHAPRLLLVEHPTLELGPADVLPCAVTLRSVIAGRGMGALVITGDGSFAAKIATRRLAWRAATGRLTEKASWRSWFRQG